MIRFRHVFVAAALAALGFALASCGYSTVRGIEFKPLGTATLSHEASDYYLVLTPRPCYGPEAECKPEVDLEVNALIDTLLSAVPDSLNVRMAGWDTVIVFDTTVVFDTTDIRAGRYWAWKPLLSSKKIGGKTTRARYLLLVRNAASVRDGDTLSIAFTGRALRGDGTTDTLRIRRTYRAKRFEDRVMTSI